MRNRDETLPNDVQRLRKRIVNFLAHLLTGDSTDEILVGSFAGDFCRGRLDRHPDELRKGIRLHRLVDAFAEQHRAFSAVRAMLRPSLGLYSAVGADMLIDHVLANEWSRWVPRESLEQFEARIGPVLLASESLPRSAARVARMMIERSWLRSYAEHAGIRDALVRMTGRVRGSVRLEDAMLELESSRTEMWCVIESFLDALFSSERLLEVGMRDDLGQSGRMSS